ncbi:hypothetical protein BDN72DRAFT_847527 [Pluteus cervinus]|uniref:Uncharacterized protein n=1 Tax=Pluteus cervinus TaxID=181527 RepID=A0ACD3ADY9_9AGAR|nr:hypothetical protein BDN72DRAFT_847527 [Pluteus cervinus]
MSPWYYTSSQLSFKLCTGSHTKCMECSCRCAKGYPEGPYYDDSLQRIVHVRDAHIHQRFSVVHINLRKCSATVGDSDCAGCALHANFLGSSNTINYCHLNSPRPPGSFSWLEHIDNTSRIRICARRSLAIQRRPRVYEGSLER